MRILIAYIIIKLANLVLKNAGDNEMFGDSMQSRKSMSKKVGRFKRAKNVLVRIIQRANYLRWLHSKGR